MRHLAKTTIFAAIFSWSFGAFAQKNKLEVIAYYAGPSQPLDSFPLEKLDILIFSFAHLKGDSIHIYTARDSATLQKMILLKQKYPNLKVMVSLGGWGGCLPCSEIFSNANNRKDFAKSCKKLLRDFGADGIDMDWEYPAIAGYPGHKFDAADKDNFTKLIVQLRKKLGHKKELSFAAGGFPKYISNSIDWKKVMPKVNRVNLMSYDLVDGYASRTGNHTALYSTTQQSESVDSAVSQMISLGVPPKKIAIGAAFYAKVWRDVPDTAFGMYQPGVYKMGVSFKYFDKQLNADSGFVYHWDSSASAPYVYNPAQKLFATFDNKRSIELKVKYAIARGLNGIMFWQLGDDAFSNGLLDAIDKAKKED